MVPNLKNGGARVDIGRVRLLYFFLPRTRAYQQLSNVGIPLLGDAVTLPQQL